jgi:hypothetical protein
VRRLERIGAVGAGVEPKPAEAKLSSVAAGFCASGTQSSAALKSVHGFEGDTFIERTVQAKTIRPGSFRVKYLLDTCAVSDYLHGVDFSGPGDREGPSGVGISAVAVMKLRNGATLR